MILLPKHDGKTHINVYSRGETQLGRELSNFHCLDIITEDGPFKSIEGYWYWLSTGREELRTMWGAKAKDYGRLVRGEDWPETPDFKRKISSAIKIKLFTLAFKEVGFIEDIRQTLSLPLVHYYWFGDYKLPKVTQPEEGQWILEVIDEWRKDVSGWDYFDD